MNDMIEIRDEAVRAFQDGYNLGSYSQKESIRAGLRAALPHLCLKPYPTLADLEPPAPDPRLAAVAAWRDYWNVNVTIPTDGVAAVHTLLSDLLTRVAALEGRT